MKTLISITLLAAWGASASATELCQGLLSEHLAARQAELERLSAPRSLVWGRSDRVTDALAKILPSAGWRARVADGTTGTYVDRIEDIYFDIKKLDRVIPRDHVKMIRRTTEGRENFYFEYVLPRFPITLMVERTESGYAAHLEAWSGGYFEMLFYKRPRAKETLSLDYALDGALERMSLRVEDLSDHTSRTLFRAHPERDFGLPPRRGSWRYHETSP